MKLIRWTIITALLGFVGASSAGYGQSQGHDPRPGSSQGHDPSQGDHDRYHDDRDRDHDRYHDRDHDHYDNDGPPRPWEDVGFFYDELEPYGDWVLSRDYGWAWFPREVHPYWRPYTEGRWVITEAGWTWVSYEPFGWATYHYGRWLRDERIGWLWVPGTIWGPAWVSWQHGGGYVGWAPLPPSVGFEIGVGIRLGGVDLGLSIRPDAYNFVPERSFLESRLSGHLVPRVRNRTLVHTTTNVTDYSYVDNRVVNRGVEARQIEKATGRAVRSMRISGATAKTQAGVGESEVRIYRPDKKKLDAVRVGRRANAGERAEKPPAGRDADRPPAQRRDPADLEVAPRNDRAPQLNPRELERQERRAREELERFQAGEKQQIEKLHQQELAKARAQADRKQIEQQQKAESEALAQEQRKAAQELEARQEARRKAALAKPKGEAKPKDEAKAADPPKKKKKNKPPKGGGGFYSLHSLGSG